MQVYVEFALLENFCMDFTLLYCAKIVCKNRAHIVRVIIAAAAGAAFAVVFPLFNLKSAWAAVIKILSGLIICLLAGKYGKVKAYLKMTAIFFAFTFLLGGALIGAFSLAGVKYEGGAEYIISSVPVGIPLFSALMLIIFARKIALKLKTVKRTTVACKIYLGEKSVALPGFFDSGNRVYHLGQPVSVIPLSAALKIVDESRIKDAVKIHTVAGSKKLKIFTADKIEIEDGGRIQTARNVIIGISPSASGGAVLHPDLSEE